MNQAENSSLSLAAFDIYVLHIIATRPQILAHSWKKFSGCYWRRVHKIFRGYFLGYCSFWLGLTQDVRGRRGVRVRVRRKNKKKGRCRMPSFSISSLPLLWWFVCFRKKGKCKDLTLKQSYFYFHVKWLVKKGYMWRQEERYTNTLQKLLIKTYNNNKNKALVPKLWGWLSVLKRLIGVYLYSLMQCVASWGHPNLYFYRIFHDKWIIFTLDIKIVLLFWSFLLPLELPLKLFFISLLFFVFTIMNTLYLPFSLFLHD